MQEAGTLVHHVVDLRRVMQVLDDRRELRRLERVERELRRAVGVGVPKARAAEALGISRTALQRWIDAGRLPVVGRPGTTRLDVDARSLYTLATEVSRLEDEGVRRNRIGLAFRRLDEQGIRLRRMLPNQPAAELRYEFEHTSPLDRLREANELSHFASVVAIKGAEARARRR